MSATRPKHRAARRATRSAGAALVVLAAVGGMGAASAYWSGVGEGAGAADTLTTATGVTLAPGAVTASLHPGGRGDVTARATNPGAAEVVLLSLDLDTTQGSDGVSVDADHPGCPTTAFSYTSQDNDGAGWVVPGRADGTDGTLALLLPDAVDMAGDAPNGCQGARVTVFLRAP